jgi:altronate dehydratase
MSGDLDLSAGDVLEGKASIADVGEQVFEHICLVASERVQAKAEIHKHREFQVWTQSAISL